MKNGEAGKDKCGYFVMFGSYRCDMPDAETANACAVARQIRDALTALVKGYDAVDDNENMPDSLNEDDLWYNSKVAISKARGE